MDERIAELLPHFIPLSAVAVVPLLNQQRRVGGGTPGIATSWKVAEIVDGK